MKEYYSRISYQLRIQIEGIEPAIWRRIIVPGEISLYYLHRVFQASMGWQDSHLHAFLIDRYYYTDTSQEPDEDDLEERDVALWQVARRQGMHFRYDYDFGDNWHHDVLVERIRTPRKPLWIAPTCLQGARACPPEDCGGVPGYERLLKILRNPRHKEYHEMRAWAGDFQPERYQVSNSNALITALVTFSSNEVSSN